MIIDEISIVSNEIFATINLRLQQIKCNSKIMGECHSCWRLVSTETSYGKLDFHLRKGYSAFAPNLWQENFKLFDLTVIMHQKMTSNLHNY